MDAEFVDNAGTEIDKQKFPFIVLGNKADKEADRQIGKPRAEAWCKGKNNIPLFETSAVSKLNLDEAFDLIAQAAGRGESIPSVALSNVNDLEKKQPEEDGDEEAEAADGDEQEESKPKSKSKIKRAEKKGRRTSAQVGSPRHKKHQSRRNAPRTAASDDSDTDPTDSSDDDSNAGDKRGRSKRDADRPSRRASPNDDDYGRPQHSNASSARGGRRRGARRSVSPDGTINLDRNSYFSGSSDMERQNCCGVTF